MCKRHRNRYSLLVKVRGKTGQLSSVVSSLCSSTVCSQQEPLHKGYQKPAAWTTLPLKEGKPVQSANLCLLCCHLCWHNSTTACEQRHCQHIADICEVCFALLMPQCTGVPILLCFCTSACCAFCGCAAQAMHKTADMVLAEMTSTARHILMLVWSQQAYQTPHNRSCHE